MGRGNIAVRNGKADLGMRPKDNHSYILLMATGGVPTVEVPSRLCFLYCSSSKASLSQGNIPVAESAKETKLHNLDAQR